MGHLLFSTCGFVTTLALNTISVSLHIIVIAGQVIGPSSRGGGFHTSVYRAKYQYTSLLESDVSFMI